MINKTLYNIESHLSLLSLRDQSSLHNPKKKKKNLSNRLVKGENENGETRIELLSFFQSRASVKRCASKAQRGGFEACVRACVRTHVHL